MKYASVEALGDSCCYCVFAAVNQPVFYFIIFWLGDIRGDEHDIKP